MEYPSTMDQECIPICDALNTLAGIRTVESCCGHGKNAFMVFFMANTVEDLRPILRAAESSAWTIEVYWSNGAELVMFFLRGPTGPAAMPGGANDFASWVKEAAEIA